MKVWLVGLISLVGIILAMIYKIPKNSRSYKKLELELDKIEAQEKNKLHISRLERLEIYEKVMHETDIDKRNALLLKHYTRKREELDDRNGY